MTKRIAINGFGRIGRLTLRNLLSKPVETVAIRDLCGTTSFYNKGFFRNHHVPKFYPGIGTPINIWKKYRREMSSGKYAGGKDVISICLGVNTLVKPFNAASIIDFVLGQRRKILFEYIIFELPKLYLSERKKLELNNQDSKIDSFKKETVTKDKDLPLPEY